MSPRIALRVAGGIVALGMTAKAPAALTPPTHSGAPDSAAVMSEKGVQFTRSVESASLQREAPLGMFAAARFRWKTEWQKPQGDAGRIRQDGRWYIGASRHAAEPIALWMVAQGEHFDDRPRASPSGDRIPGSWRAAPEGVPRNEALTRNPAASLNSIRILRAGLGTTIVPLRPIEISAAVGPVQDRRYGQERNGSGVWAILTAPAWELHGYEQNLSISYGNETPRALHNRDLAWDYSIQREFFAGNTNRAETSGALMQREFLFDATGRESRRTEKKYGFRDVLTYSVTQDMRVEMTGELANKRIEQSQPNVSSSLLEESQVGFGAALDGRSGSASGRLEAGVQAVSQTIRGDIHQGRRTHLRLQGFTPFVGQSRISMRLGVTKYTLDTRSARKDDDRDELRYAAEANWSRPLWGSVLFEWRSLAHLDHLVYLYRQSSANNRWTRLFLTGVAIHHRPLPAVRNRLRADVSANYQDYDFETASRATRSNVHRYFVMDDSLAAQLSARWGLNAQVRRKIEEFGRLFWDSFEEERSDETHSTLAATSLTCRVIRTWNVGAGFLWDSRRAIRFPDVSNSSRTVFQDIRSYGPTFLLSNTGNERFPRRVLLKLQGRALRQFQLERDDRWIVTGEFTGSLRW